MGAAVVRRTVVVRDAGRATAADLAAHESLSRLGIATQLVLLVCAVALALIQTLKPRRRHPQPRLRHFGSDVGEHAV